MDVEKSRTGGSAAMKAEDRGAEHTIEHAETRSRAVSSHAETARAETSRRPEEKSGTGTTISAEKKYLFESAPISKAVISLVVPTVISQIIFVIYNIADTFFIGQLGDANQVAAASLSMPPFVMLIGISNLFGIGGASLISRSLGRGEHKRAKHCAAFSIWSATAVALVYGLVIYVWRDWLLPFLGTDSSTYGYCSDYIFWTITVGAVPTVLNACMGHLVRSEGYSKQASVGMAIGGGLNMILDPMFIFAFGLEIAGAAIATMISNVVATLYFVVLLYKKRRTTTIVFSPKYYTLGQRIPGEVVAVGFPSLVIVLLGTVSSLVTNKLIVAYSNEAVAGMGIAKRMDMFAFGLANGMTQGVLPLIGYTYASKNFARMRSAIKTALRYALVATVVCTGCLFVFAVPIAKVFIDNAVTVEYAQHYLQLISLSCPMVTITTLMITIFQATAQTVQPMILSVAKRGVIDVLLMFLMNYLIGANGIPVAVLMADSVAMIISLLVFAPYWKRVKGMDAAKIFGGESR